MYLFYGASFSNSAPAEVDEGAVVNEGNPLTLMYFSTLVYFNSGQIRGRVPE